jgi:hypothetical protein
MEETTEGMKVEWAKDKLKDIFMTDKYYEKGLLDTSSMMDGKKVKEIVGYFEDENGEEDEETIGYVYSTSGDIDTISQDTLDDAFYNSLISTKKSYRTGLRENSTGNSNFESIKQSVIDKLEREYQKDIDSNYMDTDIIDQVKSATDINSLEKIIFTNIDDQYDFLFPIYKKIIFGK